MPSYNSSEFIEESIISLLNQSYSELELLITDDCSSDETVNIIRKYEEQDSRVKVFVLDKNAGAGVARNNSISHANGRFIAFCDSDDMWHRDKLKKQIELLQYSNAPLCYSSYDIIDTHGRFIQHIRCLSRVDYSTILRNNYIGCLTVVYDTTKTKGKVYMPTIRKRQDWATWICIIRDYGESIGINESLAYYRNVENSLSSKKIELVKYNWSVYRNFLEMNFIKSLVYTIIFIFAYLHYKNIYK